MFVHDFLEIDLPAGVVVERLSADEAPRQASDAMIGVEFARHRGDVTIIPIEWDLADDDGPVARVLGELELVPVANGAHTMTFAALSATYPDARAPRDPSDAAALHRRVARATRRCLRGVLDAVDDRTT